MKKIPCIIFLTILSFVSTNNSSIIYASTVDEGEEVHWEYGGANNPTRWGEIKSEYSTCSIGENQSPIDLPLSNLNEKSSRIKFNYQETPLVVLNNGHTIQIDYTPGSYVTIAGEKYELQQFHFHTPSEHTIDGKATALELHFVHKNEAGKLAVVAVLIEEGSENSAIQSIFENIPNQGEKKAVENMTINANLLLPESTAHYHYSGSLTTPPCSEDVNWNIMVDSIEASAAEIEQFMEFYQFNARPVQTLNNRILEISQ